MQVNCLPIALWIKTAVTDTGPHCMGTFASRATHRVGNAVIMAAKEAREKMLEVAAIELKAKPEELDTDGQGNIYFYIGKKPGQAVK